MNSWENLQILPMGNVRHFRRIRKNDALFLKMCVFREILLNLCIFREHLVNSNALALAAPGGPPPPPHASDISLAWLATPPSPPTMQGNLHESN